MDEGIKQHELHGRNFELAKRNALGAGLLFISVRACFDYGEWLPYVERFRDRIRERTVQKYMEFAQGALEWARLDRPALKSGKELEAHALEMVMQSPKGYVALLRELNKLPRHGEYDPDAYAIERKVGKQLEFGRLMAHLGSLERLGESNFRLVLPEGKDEREALRELDAKLEAIRAVVRAQLKDPIAA